MQQGKLMLAAAIGALVVTAGCTNNPRYGEYKAQRELVLAGQVARESQTIPVTLPVEAPTPAQIAGGRVNAGTGAVVTTTTGKAVSTASLKEFAQSTKHNPGTRLWSRPVPADTVRAARACAGYTSADAAQTAFLSRGGPSADPAGMDPDGDGFVCGWTPDRYRL